MIADNFRKEVAEFRADRDIKLVAISADATWENAVFLANEDNPHIRSACVKICERVAEHGLRGAIIMLTQAEFDAIVDPNEFRAVSLGEKRD